MAAHTYWRLNITANNGDTSFLGFAELELRGTVGGADQCTGGTALASSFDSTTPPAQAFDNDASTVWSTPINTLTGWVGYQFPTPVSVVEYTVQARASSLTRMPKDWSLEYSDDGSTWTPVETRVGQTWPTAGEVRTFTIPLSTNVRASQLVVETIRLPLSVAARASQLAVEVIRINTATKISCSQLAVEVIRPNAVALVTSRPQVFVCT